MWVLLVNCVGKVCGCVGEWVKWEGKLCGCCR